MIYQEKVTFNGDDWFQLTWKDIDFQEFDNKKRGIEINSIEELLEIFPDIEFTPIPYKRKSISENNTKKVKKRSRKKNN